MDSEQKYFNADVSDVNLQFEKWTVMALSFLLPFFLSLLKNILRLPPLSAIGGILCHGAEQKSI